MRPAPLLALLSVAAALLMGIGVLALMLVPQPDERQAALSVPQTVTTIAGESPAGATPTTEAAPSETPYPELTILSIQHENHFPTEMVFHLEAAGPEPIEEVTLYLTSETHARTSYAYPEFEPGRRIQAVYRFNTRKNYIVPSTLIRYHFVVKDASGKELRSEERSFRYDDLRFDWKSVERDGITVYWYGKSDRQANDVTQWALGALERLSQEFGVQREKPIRIYVYANKTDLNSARPPTSEVFARETITLGEAHAPEVLLILGGARGLRGVVYHEMSHLIVGQLVENADRWLPRWLDEGLAMYAEGDLSPGHKVQLQMAIATDSLMSVPSISGQPGDPDLVNLFYAESYSVVKFLIDTYGKEKLHALLLAFRDGAGTNSALMEVYGFDQKGLDELWRASLGLEPRP